jgi:hypothetical protein
MLVHIQHAPVQEIATNAGGANDYYMQFLAECLSTEGWCLLKYQPKENDHWNQD